MRLLFITDNFPPEVNASATRAWAHLRVWQAEREVQITVLTTAPNYPQGKVYDGYKNRLYTVEQIENIRVIRLWSYISSNSGFIRRVFDYCSFAGVAIFASLLIKTDLILITSPQFFLTFTGRIASRLKCIPWVLEVRDLWPDSIVEVGALKPGRWFKIFKRFEYNAYRSANRIITVTQHIKKTVQEMVGQTEKVHFIPNGILTEDFQHFPGNTISLKEQLGIKDQMVIGYVGTHGMAHNLSFILSAIAEASLENFFFLFIGDGAEKNNLIIQAQELKLTNVHFVGQVSKEELPSYWNIIDMALVNLKNIPLFEGALPSKIFEAAALKQPILLGVVGEAKELIEQYDAGLSYNPSDPMAFINAIQKLSKPTVYKQKQEGCIALAEAFDRNRLAKNYLSILRELK